MRVSLACVPVSLVATLEALAANDFSAALVMSNVELRHQAASGASRTVGLVSMPNRGEG
jgi:hypothetical protein